MPFNINIYNKTHTAHKLKKLNVHIINFKEIMLYSLLRETLNNGIRGMREIENSSLSTVYI